MSDELDLKLEPQERAYREKISNCIRNRKPFELKRSFRADIKNFDKDSRVLQLAFSSEEPYERWFGTEILDHSPDSVRLDRLNGGAALLVNHNADDQVGVVVSASVDADKRGRASVRFSRSARGKEIQDDVEDEIRTLASVGYSIDDYDVEERKDGPDKVIVRKWTPFEISIVPIPADATVGFGKSKNKTEENKFNSHAERQEKMADKDKETEDKTSVDADAERKAARDSARTEEMSRMDGIKRAAEKYTDIKGVNEIVDAALRSSDSVEKVTSDLLECIGRNNAEARKHQDEEADVDLSSRDLENFSMVRLMEHLANPQDGKVKKRAAHEIEVVAAAESRLLEISPDVNVRGVFVPRSVMNRDLSVGSDGSLVGTDHLGGSYIDVLRNNMTALAMGAQILPSLRGNVDIPRQTGGAAATWVSAEDDNATESEATFDTVSMAPKDLAVYTEVTRRLTQQSSPAIEGIVTRDLAMAEALGLDTAVFYGTGASGQPQGINGATGVGDPTVTAGAPTHTQLTAVVKSVLAANAFTSRSGWVISPDTWEHCVTTLKDAGVAGYILNESIPANAPEGTIGTINGRPVMLSTQLAADDFVFGDFTNTIIGEWGGYELNVDPYTHSLKGKVRYVVFKTCDIAIRHPEAFSFHDNA